MSFAAIKWAVSQRGLKPATKIVLIALADRHHPEHGCFPSQETIAEDAEMSRASVNSHLGLLETLGLIQRETRLHPTNKRQLVTRYELRFDRKAVSKIQTRAVSKKQDEPCPIFDESRVQILDSNLVKEEPVIEEPAAAPPEAPPPPPPPGGGDGAGGGGRGDHRFIERIREAAGLSSGKLPYRWSKGAPEILAWRSTGLSDEEIETVVRLEQFRIGDQARRLEHGRPYEPPLGPKAFEDAIARYAKNMVGLPQRDRERQLERCRQWLRACNEHH